MRLTSKPALLMAAVLLCGDAYALDPVERLIERVENGEARLEHGGGQHGWLASVLRAFDIPVSSQSLVFSKTSAQFRLITPESPRAVYFNDDVYVGWVRGGPILEISAADPEGGGVFYTLSQTVRDRPVFRRDSGQCLQCHESARTLGVPGHLIRSVYPSRDGLPLFSAGTFDVDDTTPIEQRWGGWFIDGAPDGAAHMGARTYVETEEGLTASPLEDVYDRGRYLSPYSDAVAHLVLTHQVQMHNAIALAGIEARKAIAYRDEMIASFGAPSEEMLASVKRRIERPAEELVRWLFFSGGAPLDGPVSSPAGFAEEFAALGPRDSRGRSLRDLDLDRGLLVYPCSWLIYSEAFAALPEATKKYVQRRIGEILSGEDESEDFAHLTAETRSAIREILDETWVGK